MKAFGGTLAALALLAVGLCFLPASQTASAGGIFATLWLLVAASAALAFSRELLMLLRLRRIRRRWRKLAKNRRRYPGAVSRFTPLRERERRLD